MGEKLSQLRTKLGEKGSLLVVIDACHSGTMTRGEMLLHVITHGAYHRGNVGQMLKFISVAPPRDLFTKFLHYSEPARRRA